MNTENTSTTDWIRELIDRGDLWRFYKTREWLRLKARVLSDQHHECQVCKGKGTVTRYEDGKLLQTVHHVKEVRKHPELALSRYYYDAAGRKRDNLICICKKCHNLVHSRTFNGKKTKGFTNKERW